MKQPIRVTLVEDQVRTREGLAARIAYSPGFQNTGAYPSMEELLPALQQNLPDVLLADIGLTGISGVPECG